MLKQKFYSELSGPLFHKNITILSLFPVDRDTHAFFCLQSNIFFIFYFIFIRVTFLMPRDHVVHFNAPSEDIFSVGRRDFLLLRDEDKFGVDNLDAKRPVSFPLEDKHVVKEHHVIRKSHDATQKKYPYLVHFNVSREWFETNSRHQKRYSEGGKKFVGVEVYWEEYVCVVKCSAIAKLNIEFEIIKPTKETGMAQRREYSPSNNVIRV